MTTNEQDNELEPSAVSSTREETTRPGEDSSTAEDAAAPPEVTPPEAPAAPAEAEAKPEPETDTKAAAPPEAPAEPKAETRTAPSDSRATKPSSATPDEGAAARSKMSRARQARVASLYRAFRAGRPIDGSVEAVIKGGYEIRLGKIRGFCPHSQFDLQRIEKPEEQVGKKYAFRITQLRRGGDDIVVSRRAVLEDARRDDAKALYATLIEGAITRGHVAGVAEFGAFVDLGAGVMGLVHVSELSHSRVTRVGDAVKVGDAVNVKILKLDEKNHRISLSVRQAEADPWSEVAERFEVGKSFPGVIKRIADFGVFVELAPGIEALAPASEFPPSRESWKEKLQPGETGDWLVLSVDARQRRISVTPPVEGFAVGDLSALEPGASLTGRVQRVEKFGVFVWLGPGRVGLMPNVWTGTPRGDDLTRRFPVADEVEVDVVEVSEGGRRIRLAKKGVSIEAAPRSSERRRPKPDRDRPREGAREGKIHSFDSGGPNAFGSTLADKLRAALGDSEDET